MSARKKTSGTKGKGRTSKTTRRATPKPKAKPKAKLQDASLAAQDAAAAPDDPIGACQFTDNSGQIACVDNITKGECAKLKNSIFLVGETCE